MRFEPESLHGANAGLNVARELMEKVKQEFPWISYGDLWTLAGVAAVQEMAGPHIPWRPGRIDGFSHHATPDGRLPDATQGSDHLRNIFYRMGFVNQKKVVELLLFGNWFTLFLIYPVSTIKILLPFLVLTLSDDAMRIVLVLKDLGLSPLRRWRTTTSNSCTVRSGFGRNGMDRSN